ncbi:unnamed protein product [Lactuca saligna]|uniref:Uncharacterized protein n=1 Tax=Lactuca saligna TaxID=75948 RepID=A0AA36A3P1_LACSI|nr:unnamed protein product [Lactuca saligna]
MSVLAGDYTPILQISIRKPTPYTPLIHSSLFASSNHQTGLRFLALWCISKYGFKQRPKWDSTLVSCRARSSTNCHSCSKCKIG